MNSNQKYTQVNIAAAGFTRQDAREPNQARH